jgi:hypothetical protein
MYTPPFQPSPSSVMDGVSFISHAALTVIQNKLTTIVIEGASHGQFAASNA